MFRCWMNGRFRRHARVYNGPSILLYEITTSSGAQFVPVCTKNHSAPAILNSKNHYLCCLYEGGSGLTALEVHFTGRSRGDYRSNLLLTDGNDHLCHQTTNSYALDSADQLVSSTESAHDKLPLRRRSCPGPKEQSVHFALWNTVVSSGSANAANLLLVNPLLNRGKADPQLQSRISQPQQRLSILFGLVVLPHRPQS